MNEQIVITEYCCRTLPIEIQRFIGSERIFAVCGRSVSRLPQVKDLLSSSGCVCVFSDFEPNPSFDSIIKGRDLFKLRNCGAILAVGGGSAIDVAKCIKCYADTDSADPFIKGLPEENTIGIVAVPTTAGTGSEATRFAVVYYKGEKQSVERDDLVPQFVILDSSLLETLPAYQRRATAFDALCHAIESLWSVNSTDESRGYSLEAIRLFFTHHEGYLSNVRDGNDGMLKCANIAGKAINLAKTTAAHAMSYKISTIKGISHGHSAAVCLPGVWKFIADNINSCTDVRGRGFVREVLYSLNEAFGYKSDEGSIAAFQKMVSTSFPPVGNSFSDDEIGLLCRSVNLQRLKNSPVPLDADAVEAIYKSIVL